MKVNISGVGLIPKVGLLAPVYGKDLTKDTVAIILNYASFKVYQASTGIRITKKNIDKIFGDSVKQAAVLIHATTTPTTHTVSKKTKNVDKIEDTVPVVEETVVETVPEVLPEITEENINEVKEAEPVVVEAEADVADIADIDVSASKEIEDKPTYTNKKKKRH